MSDRIISDRNAAAFLAGKSGSQSDASMSLKKLFHLRYDPKKWLAAVEKNKISVEWIVKQLKGMAEEGAAGQRMAAMDRLLGLIETMGLAWDKVGEHFKLDSTMADGLRGKLSAADVDPPDNEVQAKLDHAIPALRSVG